MAVNKKNLWKNFISLLVCLMLMLVVPIWRDHKLFGWDIPDKNAEEKIETIQDAPGGFIINTSEIGKNILGYRSSTPVEITVSDGKIKKIKPLDNQETPEFFGAVLNSDLFESLDGLTLPEAVNAKIDAVSGATYTSKAYIDNIRQGIEFALNEEGVHNIPIEQSSEKLPLKFYITIVIILAGGIIPFFTKNQRYRTLQLILNIILLGFWGGTFISYSLMTSYLSNGVPKVIMIPIVLMLIAAFIYPFFGKKNYYCAWMCPYGSFQELLGKCIKYKLPISAKVVKGLTFFRQFLWFTLMWLLWTGLWFDWMGYEPFAAFFFTEASAVTLGIAGAFLILSVVVNRPYCRFVCPTGTLFKYSEGSY